MTSDGGLQRRRRGEALEAAILRAAWEVLEDSGLAGFTFEAIATRANTSRPVLSRRWATRDEILFATIERRWAVEPIAVPDTGDLRDDALELLHRANSARASLMIMLMAQLGTSFRASGTSLATIRARLDRPGGANGCAQIVARAVARDEIPRAQRSRRLIDLPFDLLRHDILVTLEPVPDEAIVEIVDDVWLPLLQSRTITP